MEIILVTAAGLLLDTIFGDPRWLPHPIRFIGLLIDGCEKLLRRIFPKTEKGEFTAGILLNLIVLSISFAVPFLLLKGLALIHPWLKYAAETFFCYQIFAAKSLKTEGMRVYRYIKADDLPKYSKYRSCIL